MIAPINKILPFSVVDGEGNRVSIFFQACNIKCLYCHNPETQTLCNSCGKCIETCPSNALKFHENNVLWIESNCTHCDTCIKKCQNFSSPKVKYMSVLEVYNEIQKSIPFIRGITVSGGECTLYSDFLQELFLICKKDGLTCLIDTNGATDLTACKNLIEICDGVMIDVKAWNIEKFINLTGCDNHNLESNLKYLQKQDKIEEIRIVYIENFVDAEDILNNLSNIISKSTKIKLIKFRKNGVKTAFSNMPSPSDEIMLDIKNYANNLGFTNVIII